MNGRIVLRIACGIAPDAGHGTGEGRAFIEREVGFREGMTVLDALEVLRGSGEPGLRYRHSCHHGSCGTCGAIVDGKEALMCLARLEDLLPGPVTIEPLRGMAAVGDLAVDSRALFRFPARGCRLSQGQWPRPCGSPRGTGPAVSYVRFEACIECGLCVSACPVFSEGGRPSRAEAAHPRRGTDAREGAAAGFLGPAALAMADRDREERPDRAIGAIAFASRGDGVAACRKAFACSRACPQGVAPGRRIANLRKGLEQG